MIIRDYNILEVCVCDPVVVVLEALGGGGSFEIEGGLYFDEHLTHEVDRPVQPDDQTYVGIQLIGITNPNMVVTVVRLWATSTSDPNDPDMMTLLQTDISGCAMVHPMMGAYPQPNPYDPDEPNADPHLAFEIEPGDHFAGFTQTFIHYQTKVCVANYENCYGACPDMAGNDDSFERLPNTPFIVDYQQSNSTSYLIYKENKQGAGYKRKLVWDKLRVEDGHMTKALAYIKYISKRTKAF